jgi:glucitol/sorbitol PTS system EIIB component
MTRTETETTQTETGAVFVRPGSGGWGAGLLLDPATGKDVVLSVTGGGIHPVAARIAELTGTTAVDAFTTSIPDEKVLAAVINCGGTARIGVYPRKRIPTIDIYPGGPGGPLAQFITEDIFVSDVGVKQIEARASDGSTPAAVPVAEEGPTHAERLAAAKAAAAPIGGGAFARVSGVFVRFGEIVGSIVNTFLASGRQTVQLVLTTILPFMAYVSLLMGSQIAIGALPVQYALPTLFAINGQVGCDFIPVGLALGEAKPETVAVGTPAVLLSRLITAPTAVIIAYLVSFGL